MNAVTILNVLLAVIKNARKEYGMSLNSHKSLFLLYFARGGPKIYVALVINYDMSHCSIYKSCINGSISELDHNSWQLYILSCSVQHTA